MRKWISFLLPFIGLGIFLLILRGIGVRQILDTFRSIDLPKLLVFPAFTVFILVMRGVRWRYLMRMVGIDYPLWRTTVVWTIGFFGASVTPGKVGDAVRAYYLHKDTGRPFGEAFLTVFIDRLMDVVTMLLLGVITMFIFSFYYIKIPSFWIILGVVVGMLCVFYLLLHRNIMRRLLRPLFHALVPARFKDQLSLTFNTFYDSLAVYVRNWRKTLFAYALAVGFWFGVLCLAATVAWVLEIDVPWYYVFLMMPLVTLVELIPISLSGLGTRDATVIYFFSVIGVGGAEAVGFSILYLFAGTYLTALIGFIAWLRNPVKLRE